MSNELTLVAPNASLPTPSEWSMITSMAKELIASGFLPTSIQKPAQAAAIMLKGRELGIPAMYALSNINVIKGKPVANAELMMALVKRAYGPSAIWVEETSNESCTVGYRLPGQDKDRFQTFTNADASRAQLGGDNWKKYPAAMLRARCISATCRAAFPEVIAGMYVPGELGERVTVDEDGNVTTDTNSYRVMPDTPRPQTSVTVHNPEPDHQETVDQETGEITGSRDDEMERLDAFDNLQQAADAQGFTEDEVALYFEYAGINPDTVSLERVEKIANGIRSNPVAFSETLEKATAMRELRNDPELNPSDEQLGIVQ